MSNRSLRPRCLNGCHSATYEDEKICSKCVIKRELERKPYFQFQPIRNPKQDTALPGLPGIGLYVIVSPPFHEKWGLKRSANKIHVIEAPVQIHEGLTNDLLNLVGAYFRKINETRSIQPSDYVECEFEKMAQHFMVGFQFSL